jgi:hypothetical protein
MKETRKRTKAKKRLPVVTQVRKGETTGNRYKK